MKSLANLLVLIFAAFFLDRLFTKEAGPFGSARRLRESVGLYDGDEEGWADAQEIEAADEGYSYAFPFEAIEELEIEVENVRVSAAESFLADILGCYRCFAPYAAGMAMVLFRVYRPLAELLAAAGAVIWLWEANGRTSQ